MSNINGRSSKVMVAWIDKIEEKSISVSLNMNACHPLTEKPVKRDSHLHKAKTSFKTLDETS